MQMLSRVLVVEDDIGLSNGILLALKNDKEIFVQASGVKEALRKMEEQSFSLVILDINLPDGNGLELLGEIKRRWGTPVIILTANDMEIDIVTGLEMGADDYITKPFSLMVLRARVNTQIRKKQAGVSSRIVIENMMFDFEKMEFTKDSLPIEFSRTEQKLLKILVDNRGTTVSKSILMDRVWTDGAEYVDENALSVTIRRLRDKIEETPSKPVYIRNIYGIGYVFTVV